MFDLTGKTAVVTGAAAGIGEVIARTLASAGAFVYVANVDHVNGMRVAEEIVTGGNTAAFLPLDVSNKESCLAAAHTIHTEQEHLDILVNNAGFWAHRRRFTV